MSRFVVHGPCYLELCPKSKGDRKLLQPEKSFWEEYGKFAGLRGCYVFGVQTRDEIFWPYYVGLTTRTFKQEIFTGHKIDHYNRALGDCLRGKPVMFFVAQASSVGRPNYRAIKQVEHFLIQNGISGSVSV